MFLGVESKICQSLARIQASFLAALTYGNQIQEGERRVREQWSSLAVDPCMQCETEQLSCNSPTPVTLKIWGEALVETSMNRLLWQGIPGSSKVYQHQAPSSPAGTWELLSCPYRALSWPNPLLPAGERRKDDWRSALRGLLWSLCNNCCGKPHLFTAQSFSETLLQALSPFLVKHGFPYPANWDFFPSSAGKKVHLFQRK